MGILKVIREMRREHLISPRDRGLTQRLKRRLKRGKKIHERSMNIFVNTYCNLSCFSCAALGMDTRPPPVDARIEDIELFLKHMKKIHPGGIATLTGGEPTMYPHLEKVCKLVREYGFKVGLLTNGYKLHSPDLFDLIMLDHHGVNEAELEKWKKALEKSDTEWEIIEKQFHQDIPHAIKDNITPGARCENWLGTLTLYQNVVYPCCNIMCVEWWWDTFEVSEALIDAGWIIENPNLPKTIQNWRETLPSEVYRLCTIGCWRDANKAIWKNIE